MPSPRKYLLACALACTSFLVLSTAVFAADRHPAPVSTNHASTTAPAKTGCDVPGKACDPSKTDHDNGVGNNCDPGYGQGNQAKFAPDEASTGCRTKPGESSEVKPTETTSPPTAPCATTTTKTHSDSESKTAENHESTVAEQHDSGTVTKTDSDECTSGGGVESVVLTETGPITITLTKPGGEILTVVVQNVEFEKVGNNVVLTITGTVNNETKTFEIKLPAEMGEIGGVTLGELPGGGTTLTLPNGTVLSFTGGELAANGTTVPAGAATTIAGINFVNLGAGPANVTAPATGGGRGNSGLAAGQGGMGGVLGAVESEVNAATGVGLAATGLPLLGGLVGLALFLTGVAIRRRS